MIPRYTRPELAAIWEPQTRYRIWFEIEAHAADAMAELGVIPKAAAETIWSKGRERALRRRAHRRDRARGQARRHRLPHPPRRDRRAGGALRAPGHDLVRRARHLPQRPAGARRRPPDRRRRQAAGRARAPRLRAQDHADHRPHARHPRRADHLRAEARLCPRRVRARTRARLVAARARSPPARSPARSAPSPRSTRGSRRMSRQAMGLAVEPISTQVIPRDRHAMYFATLGVVGSSIERLATEIRHLQRTEVLEAEEYFSEGQKGSSAMPHKRNPVLSENLTGLARMVRAYVTPALENVALWHERDISHSSVERMIGPDATATLDFALARLAAIIDRLVVYPDNMQQEPRPPGRAHPFAARAARADPEGGGARGRLPAGPAQRHAGLARRRRFPDLPQGRPGRARAPERGGARRRISTSATTSRTSTRSSSGCSAGADHSSVCRNARTAALNSRGRSQCTKRPAPATDGASRKRFIPASTSGLSG